jgi:hypothetical protein
MGSRITGRSAHPRRHLSSQGPPRPKPARCGLNIPQRQRLPRTAAEQPAVGTERQAPHPVPLRGGHNRQLPTSGDVEQFHLVRPAQVPGAGHGQKSCRPLSCVNEPLARRPVVGLCDAAQCNPFRSFVSAIDPFVSEKVVQEGNDVKACGEMASVDCEFVSIVSAGKDL